MRKACKFHDMPIGRYGETMKDYEFTDDFNFMTIIWKEDTFKTSRGMTNSSVLDIINDEDNNNLEETMHSYYRNIFRDEGHDIRNIII